MDDDRSAGLLRWQMTLYPSGHATRRNLALHVLTAPVFMAGTVTLVTSAIALAPLGAAAGGIAMLVTIAAQGAGHKGEPTRPVPFRGPLDFVARFFVEQWITFPRFVLSGGFARAWKGAARTD